MSRTLGPTVGSRTGRSNDSPVSGSVKVKRLVVIHCTWQWRSRAIPAPGQGGRVRSEARAGPLSARPPHYNNAGRPRKRNRYGMLLAGGKPVAASKLVDSAAGIDDLLLTRVERMARRAHLDVQVVPERRARLDDVAAAARDRDFPVLGVNVCFHRASMGSQRGA